MQLLRLRLRPSFSRDFTVLAVAVSFLLALLTLWIGYDTYRDYQQRLTTQMAEHASRMDRVLMQDIQQTSYLLETIGRQILRGNPQPEAIAQLLKAFETENTLYNLFGWADASQRLTVVGAMGVLPHPQDISDRDYAKKSLVTPWRVHIGRPVEGRLSGQWIIPLAMGVEDAAGNPLGIVIATLNIEKLTQQLREVMMPSPFSFALMTHHLVPVADASTRPDFMASYFPLEQMKKLDFVKHPTGAVPVPESAMVQQALTYYQHSSNTPFVLLLGVEMAAEWRPLLSLLWQRLFPLVMIALFSAVVLLVIRSRVIEPLAMLGEEAGKLLRGEALTRPVKGPSEITLLGKLLQQISAYIQERRRIEYEQKAKLTFLKRAKDTAEISNRVKVDFLTSMSHEFRTPLNTISGFIELMKNEVYGAIGNERYRQYIADIHDSVNALQSLVADVIALSKAESTQAEANEKPLELQLVVARSIRHLADKLKEAGVTVENRVREDMPKLRVDEARLRQIIQNLLFNALSHTPSGGSIVVEARVTEDKLHQPVFEMIITDFGAKRLPQSREGEENFLQRRGKKALGPKPGNLGVPLTKALVAMQQASLEVESPPGKATTVTVRYPKEKIVL